MSLKLKGNGTINHTVALVTDLANISNPEVDDICIVTDENRGGTFVYRGTGTDNSGTIFSGWHRQYDGAVNVKWFGANVNELNNAPYIQSAMDIFEQVNIEEVYKITEPIILSRVKQRLFGGGGIDGSYLQIGETSGARIEYYFKVENLKFIDSSFSGNSATDLVVGTSDGIKLVNCGNGEIQDCFFQHKDSAISVISNSATQHVRRIKITNNKINYCNYFVFTNREATQTFGVGDIHIHNNMAEGGIQKTHLELHGVDGAVITGNTFFFPGYTTSNLNKEYNIFLDSCHFVLIDSNNLFEAGYQAIDCRYVQEVTISNNNIPWSGQRVNSSAIRFRDGDMTTKVSGGTTSPYCLSVVSNNTITFSTRHGVEATADSGHLVISGNNIRATGNLDYFYGTDSGGLHYAVATDGENTLVSGNLSDNDFVINNTSNGSYQSNNRGINSSVLTSNRVLTLDESSYITSGALDVDSFDTVNLSYTGSVIDLSTLNINTENSSGKKVTFIGFASQDVLIKHGTGNIYLNNEEDILLTENETLTLLFSTNKWYEIGGSYTRERTFNATTETTLDGSAYSKINLFHTSPTTITSLGTSVEGKRLRLLARTGNLTIQNNTNIYTKSGADISMADETLREFVYLSSAWREV